MFFALLYISIQHVYLFYKKNIFQNFRHVRTFFSVFAIWLILPLSINAFEVSLSLCVPDVIVFSIALLLAELWQKPQGSVTELTLWSVVVSCSYATGDTFLYWFGTQPRICISDPELAKHILSNKFGCFIKPMTRPLLEKMAGRGLGLVNGADWVKHRRITSPAFTSGKLKVSNSLTLPLYSHAEY